MTSKTAGILAFLGFLLTAFGVGGIEQSINDSEMFGAMVVSITGLCIMYCAIAALQISNYYDQKA